MHVLLVNSLQAVRCRASVHCRGASHLVSADTVHVQQ